MVDITLILNRKRKVLWIDSGDTHVVAIDNITGVQRIEGEYRPVSILRNGIDIGSIWEVKEIKELWSS
jgi:hypothetical protein